MTPAMSGAVLAAAPLPLPVLPRAFIEIIQFSGRRMYGWKEAKKLVPRPAGGVGRGENADGDRGDQGRRHSFRSTVGDSGDVTFSFRLNSSKFSREHGPHPQRGMAARLEGAREMRHD